MDGELPGKSALLAAERTAWHHRVDARLLAEVFGDLSLCVLPNPNPGTALSPGQLGLPDPYRPGVPAGGGGLERRWVSLFRALKETYSSEGKKNFLAPTIVQQWIRIR